MIACVRRHRFALVVFLSGVFAFGTARAQAPAPPPFYAPPVAVAPPLAADPVPETHLPVRLALQLEAATGVATGPFHNQLLGGRVDLRFSPQISLGGYLGYANLKGKDGRAHAALTYAQLEYLAGAPGAKVRYPVRFASGYLAANGPVVRLAGGFAFALGPTIDLVTELLAPMVWFTSSQTLLSLDLALELSFRL